MRPAIGNLEPVCWTIILATIGAVTGLIFVMVTGASLSEEEFSGGSSLPTGCSTSATCEAYTSAEYLKEAVAPCNITCKSEAMAKYYKTLCGPIMPNGNMYSECMKKKAAAGSWTVANALANAQACDIEERKFADANCYMVADKHNAQTDPDATWDQGTAWETIMYLSGDANSNRCGYLTFRDMIKVMNCKHDEVGESHFGCGKWSADAASNPFLNYEKNVSSGTTNYSASSRTTCIAQNDISCGNQATAAPKGYTWNDTLPYGTTPSAATYVYGGKRIACKGSSVDQPCTGVGSAVLTCGLGKAPLKGGWRAINAAPTSAPTASPTAAPTAAAGR